MNIQNLVPSFHFIAIWHAKIIFHLFFTIILRHAVFVLPWYLCDDKLRFVSRKLWLLFAHRGFFSWSWVEQDLSRFIILGKHSEGSVKCDQKLMSCRLRDIFQLKKMSDDCWRHAYNMHTIFHYECNPFHSCILTKSELTIWDYVPNLHTVSTH